jgi:hypothetical protein
MYRFNRSYVVLMVVVFLIMALVYFCLKDTVAFQIAMAEAAMCLVIFFSFDEVDERDVD